jgi:hypothetical protein
MGQLLGRDLPGGFGGRVMDIREAFLTDVGARLPLPDDVRADVLAELATHLADATDDLVAHGHDPAEAEAEAIARLGSPASLAIELTRAHRTRDQVFAAAGAGTWAAVRDGALGLLLGWAFVVSATIALLVIAGVVRQALGITTNVEFDSGWNSVLTALGLHAGALFSGAAAVRAAARSGWRPLGEVRPWVIGAGALAWGWLVIGTLHQPLNWASAVALALVPASFVLGTFLARMRLPRLRVVGLALFGVVLIGFGLTVAVGGTSGSGATSYAWNAATHNYHMIAPWWQAPGPSDQPMDFGTTDYEWRATGVVSVTVEASSPEVVSRFSSFQLEAWQAEQPADGWHLVGGQPAPFATAGVAVAGTAISGTIRFNQTPGVDWAEVVLTGIARDGRRYLLVASSMPEQTIFQGSVWDWFAGLVRG